MATGRPPTPDAARAIVIDAETGSTAWIEWKEGPVAADYMHVAAPYSHVVERMRVRHAKHDESPGSTDDEEDHDELQQHIHRSEKLGVEAPDSGPLGGEALSDSESDSDSDGDGDEDAVPPTKLAIVRESALKLAAGMILIAVFADPMVGAVSSLSRACGMPSPFFASFVLTPFASNASELVSSLYFAAKKKKKNISLTYSQIYGAVTMNNTMCLGLFLVVMRAKGLEWTFTSETICVVAATVAVGAVGASKKTLKTSLVLPALAVYPLSLGLVVFLDFVVGLK